MPAGVSTDAVVAHTLAQLPDWHTILMFRAISSPSLLHSLMFVL